MWCDVIHNLFKNREVLTPRDLCWKIFSDMKVFQPGRIVGVLQGKWRAGKKKSKERVVSKPLDFWRGCGSHHITSRSRSLLTCAFYHTHVLTLQYSDWFIPHFTLYRNHVLSTQEPRFYLLLVVPRGKIFSDMKVFQPGRIVGVLPFPTMRITKFDRLVPQICKFAAFPAMRITKFWPFHASEM